jgi:hypothetical protein
MSKHYHVLLGMSGGYMPDTNAVVRTRRDAEETARWYAREFRDHPELFRVTGSARDGLYVIERKEAIDALPYLIEIVECFEPDCGEEGD